LLTGRAASDHNLFLFLSLSLYILYQVILSGADSLAAERIRVIEGAHALR